ncbi:ABC transporter ATP-binding protein [Paenibacillus dendritiformis]|uniref:ABC transporter ATP-binding protein n=1 Tax=Paenibacillus TaxID=44249 RepID=UPI001B005E2A|nr:ABC transporter ATP-binding protein [Paenibacillus dendritiformis]GIO77758.1 ABC transporter ATP-binding protein [Paenibacillus dendritiformis]
MLELIDLTKKYGKQTVVDNLSLYVKQGEIVGLLGPNGAGKSTTVSMISTVLAPSGGDILIDHNSLKDHSREIKKIMGVVPQDIALYEPLSAKDNLEFFGCLYGLSGRPLQARVNEVLELIGLSDHRHQDVIEFSGGMKRRVNIGVALMNNPKLLILDEPTAGIDPQSRNHILETVKHLNRETGMTVIYTSHYMEEVEFLCDRVAIMDHGRLLTYGTKDELKQSTGALDTLTFTFHSLDSEAVGKSKHIPGVKKITMENQQLSILVNPQEGNVIDILDGLRSLGAQLASFQYEEVNLEQIFLQVTGKSLRD